MALIAPKAKAASNKNLEPIQTANRILTANNKAYALRRLRINFICAIPPFPSALQYKL